MPWFYEIFVPFNSVTMTEWLSACCDTVLPLAELRPHFSLASESDAAEHDDDVDDDREPDRTSARQGRAPPATTHDDTVATSGVSTLSSTVSHESHHAQRSVSMELGRMKLETNRWPPVVAFPLWAEKCSAAERVPCQQVVGAAAGEGARVPEHSATSAGGERAGDPTTEAAVRASRSVLQSSWSLGLKAPTVAGIYGASLVITSLDVRGVWGLLF